MSDVVKDAEQLLNMYYLGYNAADAFRRACRIIRALLDELTLARKENKDKDYADMDEIFKLNSYERDAVLHIAQYGLKTHPPDSVKLMGGLLEVIEEERKHIRELNDQMAKMYQVYLKETGKS